MNNTNDMKRFDILGVRLSAVNMPMACGIIEQVIQEKGKGYTCVSPVSTIMECHQDPSLKVIVNNATLVTPDGMPSVWIAHGRGLSHVQRVYGPDLLLAMCALSNSKGYRNYFYGATQLVLERLEINLKRKFPHLVICGKIAPPFKELTLKEDAAIVREINAAHPDLVWVGLGSPKQDYWIYKHREQIEAPMMLAVGAAFDFISGTKPQAPAWMQKRGLEWFFRLLSEPQRLWKRYLIGNTRFVFCFLKDESKKILKRIKHK